MSEIRHRKKWINIGQQLHRYENLLNRQFRDLYDNSIVAYKTGIEQTVNLVLDTIRLAMREEQKRSLQSCSSIATKAFNIPPKHIQANTKIWHNSVDVKM